MIRFLPVLFFVLAFGLVQTQHANDPVSIRVRYTPGKPAASFVPSQTLGAAFDGHWGGETDAILSPANVDAMKSVGLRPISYRLRTELGDEAWHWNPEGSWSEGSKQQGYWTSAPTAATPIQLSFGYALPRRGNTHDNANDNGYSRIDDGDTATFWKSNPYLDHHYTGEADSLHPQWVIIDLGRAVPVNTLRIHWGEPYALSYDLDYALDNGDDYFEPYQPGIWHPLRTQVPNSTRISTVTLAGKEIRLRYLRITMTHSSYTGGPDLRDRLGFAIRELEAGIMKEGKFIDQIKHRPDSKQTVLRVSSTDPWHRAVDRDPNTEQAGIDRFYTCGLTSGLPALLPVGLLYDTPENMTALIRYVQERRYPLSGLEMGEEPEGQLIHPNDYAALYLQWARAIRKVAPRLSLGGPGFAALAKDGAEDAYSFSERQWTRIFIDNLRRHDALSLLDFFSFEWYPFDDVCAPAGPQLLDQPRLLSAALKPFTEEILPKGLPVYVTEYGYSAYGGEAEVKMEGGLMYADILGAFLMAGGKASFLYGLEPTYLEETNGCTWGNNMLMAMGDKGTVGYHTAAYYTVQMMATLWAAPDTLLELYPVSIPNSTITAYALRRPNGSWALALINKDSAKSRTVRITIDMDGRTKTLSPTRTTTFGRENYTWVAAGANGHPGITRPPAQTTSTNPLITLKPYSLTIVEEK